MNFPGRSAPGLFVTGTDAGVGKTVVTCAIADVLARMRLRVGVLKPLDTGARTEREGLVSDDAQALAYFANLDPAIGGLPLVSPILERLSAAPALAMKRSGKSFDPEPIRRSLNALDAGSDIVLVEGIGGMLEPIDPDNPQRTVIDLIEAMGYPALVVARADRSTLNHTALTIQVLRQRRCRIAGIVVNFYKPDSPDPIEQMHRDWLSKMNRVPVLATVPRVEESTVDVAEGVLHDEVRAAVALMDWRAVARRPDVSAQS